MEKEKEERIIPDSKILIFKLKNGEDIISICYEYPKDETHLEYFELVEPMNIATVIDEDSKGNAVTATMLIPWIDRKVVNKPFFTLGKNEIMTIVEPSKVIKER